MLNFTGSLFSSFLYIVCFETAQLNKHIFEKEKSRGFEALNSSQIIRQSFFFPQKLIHCKRRHFLKKLLFPENTLNFC